MADPHSMNALLHAAAAHFERNELDQADALCSEILAEAPSADAWHLRGLIAISRNDYVRAAEHLTAAVEQAPEDFAMHLRLSGALLALEDRERAPAIAEKTVALNPNEREAHLYLAQARLLQKRFDEANAAALRALAMTPEWPRALEILALIAVEAGKRERGLQLAERALAGNAQRAIAHRVIADVHVFRRNYETARHHYEAALRIEPKHGKILAHYALLLARLGEPEQAVETYQRSLRYLPRNTAAVHGLSLALLSLGRLNEGWPLYRNRHLFQKQAPRRADLPQLDHLPAAGERVLVWLDEGVGDQIMWASLLPDLIRTGADLIVECDPRLLPLFQRSFPQASFVPWTEPPAPISGAPPTAQFSISNDAASWLRERFENFPQRSYLVPQSQREQELRAKYRRARSESLVVGISWKTAADGKVADEKSLPLTEWGPILHMPGVTFVNLQYGDSSDEIAAAQKSFGVTIVSDSSIDPLTDIDTFAAQVAAMDLVITTSNATAHVAGALGIPTWVLVPKGFGGIWHWFLTHDDSPWYPATRIFRQPTKGDWASVMAVTSEALVNFIDARQSALKS